jgi:flavorubredoxin
MAHVETTIDHIAGGIYRISSWDGAGSYIGFNQFLIDDQQPTLVHTGTYRHYEAVREAIRQVLDPATLANVVLLHWEGDEIGGFEQFLAESPRAQLLGSALSIGLNAHGFGLTERTRGFTDGETLDLGTHTLRFLETPHVHHWDSLMLFEETTCSLFPSDLFIQPGEQPAIVRENLAAEMIGLYRDSGIFAHEDPVRAVVDRVEPLEPDWVHAMHGGTLTRDAFPAYVRALREQEFGYRGVLRGRDLRAPVADVSV